MSINHSHQQNMKKGATGWGGGGGGGGNRCFLRARECFARLQQYEHKPDKQAAFARPNTLHCRLGTGMVNGNYIYR